MTEFDRIDGKILFTLYRVGKPIPISKIAKYSEISWATAKKHLNSMYKDGWLDRAIYKNGVYWWIKTEQ